MIVHCLLASAIPTVCQVFFFYFRATFAQPTEQPSNLRIKMHSENYTRRKSRSKFPTVVAQELFSLSWHSSKRSEYRESCDRTRAPVQFEYTFYSRTLVRSRSHIQPCLESRPPFLLLLFVLLFLILFLSRFPSLRVSYSRGNGVLYTVVVQYKESRVIRYRTGVSDTGSSKKKNGDKRRSAAPSFLSTSRTRTFSYGPSLFLSRPSNQSSNFPSALFYPQSYVTA